MVRTHDFCHPLNGRLRRTRQAAGLGFADAGTRAADAGR
jgi:hypothetical protein